MTPLVDIVIVCFNCGDDIFTLAEDLKRGNVDPLLLNLVVVDNNSSDSSVAVLRTIQDIPLTIIASPQNLGFGAGCNLAIGHLVSERTLLLNPDVRLRDDSISQLLAFASQNPEGCIWGGQTVDTQGRIDGQNAWREPTLTGVLSWSFFGDIFLKKFSLRIPDAYTAEEIGRSAYVDAVSGCFLLIDTELLKTLKGFDERFFMYAEEVDLCRRARLQGARPMSTTTAVIVHEGSKTITSQDKLNFLYHSKLKYFKKHWSYPAFALARLSFFSGAVLRLALYSVLSFEEGKRQKRSLWWNFCKQQLRWRV